MRSLLSVVLGYVVMLVAALGGDVAFTALGSGPVPEPGGQPDAVYFVFHLGTGFFFLMIGGYVTALLAGNAELKHALGLAALSVTMCIVSMLEYAGDQPLWYSIALMFLSIPGSMIGSQFRARQLGDGTAPVVIE